MKGRAVGIIVVAVAVVGAGFLLMKPRAADDNVLVLSERALSGLTWGRSPI